MTLRDYFAAKAMAALIAEPFPADGDATVYHINGEAVEDSCEAFSKAAYKVADAMLKARAL